MTESPALTTRNNPALTHLDDATCLWLTDHTNGHPCNSSHLNALALPLTRPGSESWRLIDRRLQALRESGRISYVGKRKNDHGWRVSCQAAKRLSRQAAKPPRIHTAKLPRLKPPSCHATYVPATTP